MAKFTWQDGTLVSKAKVEINGTIYEVDPEEYSGTTPLSASNLNAMQDGIYEDIGNLSNLNTTDKSSLVGAVNELASKGATLLFNGNVTSNNIDVNLSDSIQNYDFILLVTRADAGTQGLIRLNTTLIPVSLYNDGGANYNIPMSNSSNVVLNIRDNTTLTTQSGFSEYFGLMRVYGIKL